MPFLARLATINHQIVYSTRGMFKTVRVPPLFLSFPNCLGWHCSQSYSEYFCPFALFLKVTNSYMCSNISVRNSAKAHPHLLTLPDKICVVFVTHFGLQSQITSLSTHSTFFLHTQQFNPHFPSLHPRKTKTHKKMSASSPTAQTFKSILETRHACRGFKPDPLPKRSSPQSYPTPSAHAQTATRSRGTSPSSLGRS